MKLKQNCTGVIVTKQKKMNNSIEQITKCTAEIRQKVGLTKEQIFWYQIDVGMKFLELHFGLDALEIASKTNFWDLFVFEWVKDDAWLLRNIDLYDAEHYLNWKITMLDDRKVCEVMNEFLEKK